MTGGVAVSAVQCEEWRKKVRNGHFSKWLARDSEVSAQTIRYHVNGKCSCVTDVDPVDGDSE